MGTSPTVEGPAIRRRGQAMEELRRREQSTREMVRREHREFGGRIQWEAVFFGLLAAIGLAASLTAMVLGGMVAAGVTSFSDDAAAFLDPLVTAGGAVAIAVLALGYLTGGYVAARMARFDGWRQGLGIWLLSACLGLAVAIAAWIAGGDLDPTKSITLPSNPIDAGPLSQGGWIILGVGALVALAFALVGGMLGERFHRAVDRAGIDGPDADSGDQVPYGPRRVRQEAPASAASSSDESTVSPAANP